MKNIRAKQKKSASSGKSEWIWTALIALVCIVGTFTVTRTFYHNADVAAAPQEEEEVSVAVSNAEINAGQEIVDCFSFVKMPITKTPENAILADSDIAGKVSSIKLMPNTILTNDMLVRVDMDEIVDDTCRQVAVNYVTIASNLVEGDFIDVRMKAYSTEELAYSDEVVLAKKKILAVQGSTVYLNLSEDEQLRLGIAAVDVSLRNSSNSNNEKAMLYSTAYANAAQSKAIVTYENSELQALLESNPQLISQAQKDLAANQEVPQDPIVEPNIETVPE